MKFAPFSFRSLTIAAAMLAAGTSANALTIPFNIFTGTSVQAFTPTVLAAFKAVYVDVIPLGNATAVPDVKGAYILPITSISINSKLKISKGDAKGSALELSRTYYDDEDVPHFGGVILANFTINYETKQVLADTTIIGEATTAKQAPLYNFHVATPLGLKYKFPLTVTGHEVLDDLRLTQQAKDAMTSSLMLQVYETPTLRNDFGTLTQDISTKLRAKPVSTKLYTPHF